MVASEWLEALEKENKDLKELIGKYRVVIKSLAPHLFEHFYLAGAAGEVDQNGLPEFIEVCPAYGAGWTMLYQKTDRTISTEGA